MNKPVFLTVAIITLMLGHASDTHATPPEVENCGQKMYSLRYLKNISKDELVEEYCTCVTYVELSDKQLVDNPTLRDVRGASNRASRNVTKIASLLKRYHQYPDAPECDIKKDDIQSYL